MYSEYYTANVVKSKIWFIIGSLKNENHWVFARAMENNDLEFFVSPDFETEFLHVMGAFENKGLVSNLQKSRNRFLNEDAQP